MRATRPMPVRAQGSASAALRGDVRKELTEGVHYIFEVRGGHRPAGGAERPRGLLRQAVFGLTATHPMFEPARELVMMLVSTR